MSNGEIHSTIFRQPWSRCRLRLDNGNVVTVDHPDYLFMPLDCSWFLWVKPEGKGLQFFPIVHIAAIDLEPKRVAAN